MDASTIAANLSALRELRLDVTRLINSMSDEFDVLSSNLRSEVQRNWIGVASQEYQVGMLNKTVKFRQTLNEQNNELSSVILSHISRLESMYQEALRAAKTVNE